MNWERLGLHRQKATPNLAVVKPRAAAVVRFGDGVGVKVDVGSRARSFKIVSEVASKAVSEAATEAASKATSKAAFEVASGSFGDRSFGDTLLNSINVGTFKREVQQSGRQLLYTAS